MKTNWILIVLSMLTLVACDPPKYETYEFKPPPPTKHDDLLKRLKNLDKCVQAATPKVELSGAFSQPDIALLDPRISVEGDVTLKFAESKIQNESSRLKPELLNVGCSDEMAAAYSDGLPIKKYKEGDVKIAQKVLLCGKLAEVESLLVHAKTLVLKDLTYVSFGVGFISLGAETLILEGKNSLFVQSFNVFGVAMESQGIKIKVDKGIEGIGTLGLNASAHKCPTEAPKTN